MDKPGKDSQLVTAEQAIKLELEITIARLNPVALTELGGLHVKPINWDTWGECSTANAPPYTKDVPKLDAFPPVNETAEQFVNELAETAIREFWRTVLPETSADGFAIKENMLTEAPTTTATAPPIACICITSKPKCT